MQLPEILVSATRYDGNAWKAKLPAFKPWTQDTERQYQAYMSGVQAMAERAFSLVESSLKSGGMDLNNPDHMAAYKEVSDALMASAYAAMKNPNAFVDGPGADDFTANDFLTALRNTDIVMTGSSDATPGQFTTNPATNRGRITLSATAIRTTMPNENFITAVSTSLFHELGHAMAGGRADLATTWGAFRTANSTLSEQALRSAFSVSPEGIAYEHRTTTRGWGIAGIANRPFDPGITGWAPR